MDIVRFGEWRLAVDAISTRRVYASVERGAQNCECAYCRNFVVARDQEYPPGFLDLLSLLGIATHREAEVAEMGPEGIHRYYVGWYHFIGEVLSDPGDQVVIRNNQGVEWSVFFKPERSLAFEEFGELPLVQLEFSAIVPWLLPEAPDA